MLSTRRGRSTSETEVIHVLPVNYYEPQDYIGLGYCMWLFVAGLHGLLGIVIPTGGQTRTSRQSAPCMHCRRAAVLVRCIDSDR